MSGQLPSADGRKNRALKIVVGMSVLLTLVLPFVLMLSELWDALRQHHINKSYVPVEATVISSRVRQFRDSDHDTKYVAEVEYKYEVAGKTYKSTRIAPLPLPSSFQWADWIVSRHLRGQPCHAFYDPKHSDRAVLIKRYSFYPYRSILGWGFVMAVGSWVILRVWQHRERVPVLTDVGLFEVAPEYSVRERLFAAKVCTTLWYISGAIVAAHYFAVFPRPYPSRQIILFGLYAAGGLVPLGLIFRHRLIRSSLSEARLLLDSAKAIPGSTLTVTVTQEALRNLTFRKFEIKLVCRGTKVKGRSRKITVLHEQTPVALANELVHAGEMMKFTRKLEFLSNLPPTGPDQSERFTHIDWEIIVTGDIADAPNYRATFPVTVEAASVEESEFISGEAPKATVEIREIEPRYARRILTKWNIVVMNAVPLLFTLLAIGMFIVGGLAAFPDLMDTRGILHLRNSQGVLLFTIGFVLLIAQLVYSLVFPGLFANRYLYHVAKTVVGGRPDAIVTPGAPDSVFVDIIPRTNWNRIMLENAADTGFLTVDSERREIRFEGDKERYRIPAEAIRSCKLEKSFYLKGAQRNAPGFWYAVVRAYREGEVWEAPFAVRTVSGRDTTKARQKADEGLAAKIKALLPTSVVQ